MSNELSIGEQRVRTTFNPSNNGLVDQIKQTSAEIINLATAITQKIALLEGYKRELKDKDPRCATIAFGIHERMWDHAGNLSLDAETFAMWAVKAATAG